MVLALVVVAGCSLDEEEQVAQGGLLSVGSTTLSPSPTWSPPPTPIGTGYDYLMADIEREVSGFAGLSVDESRNVVQVRSTQPDINLDALYAAIVSRFPLLEGKTLEIVDVSFDFGDLSAWYTQVQDVICTDPEVSSFISMTDVDEIRNQIVIGVVDEEARQKAERDIAILGLPEGAVAVEIRPFVVPL